MKFITLLVSLVIIGPSFAHAEDGPELMTFRLYEKSPTTGAYVRVDHGNVCKGEGIFHVPKDLEPYHMKGDDALPAMPEYIPSYQPGEAIPATLKAIAANERTYDGNHADYKLKITKAIYDQKTSTIHVWWTTSKKFSHQIAELNVEIGLRFYMVKR